MSGLAALVAGREPPGVRRWHAASDVEDVAHAVARAGGRFAHVDGWWATTRAEALAAIGEALDFPDHYGQNLDALVDCLRDVGPREGPLDPAGGTTQPAAGDHSTGSAGITVLLWDGWGPLAHDDPRSFAAILDILRERAGDLARPPFAVLLRGEGPEEAVASVAELS